MMKVARSLSAYLFLMMFAVVGSALVFAAMSTPASANAEDWTLVSAPPPPGPYRAVNLDPRVPGHAGISVIGNAPRVMQPPGNISSETAGTAPAAGGQANYQAPVKRLPPQVPGTYQTRMPRFPVNAYPGPSRYPVQMGRPDFGAKMPPRGYYPSQPRQPEEAVPPPPVYDAMMQAAPPGAYQSNAGRR